MSEVSGITFRYSSIPNACRGIVDYVWNNGALVKDERGELIKEILDLEVILTGSNFEAKPGKLNNMLSIDFAAGVAFDDVAMQKGESFHYAYGERLRRRSMLKKVVKMLRVHPTTRRAVIPIFQPEDVMSDLEVPCWIFQQFIIRDGKLHSVVDFRSNDLFGGFPMDIYGIRSLQFHVAQQLRIPVGNVYYRVCSAHLRMSDEDAIKVYLGCKD